jgi:two-component system, response regulator PdtaR
MDPGGNARPSLRLTGNGGGRQPMTRAKPVLLLVEDDGLVRATLVDVMTDAGFEVLEAEDARDALCLVCDHREIAALLTDINLPGGPDGFALARAARVVRPDLPVVYASGRYGAPERGRTVDGARFLAKPFTPAIACAMLYEMLGEDRQPGTARAARQPIDEDACASRHP